MSLAEKSRINLLYLICSKEIINAGRLKKSVGVRYFDKLEFGYYYFMISSSPYNFLYSVQIKISVSIE